LLAGPLPRVPEHAGRRYRSGPAWQTPAGPLGRCVTLVPRTTGPVVTTRSPIRYAPPSPGGFAHPHRSAERGGHKPAGLRVTRAHPLEPRPRTTERRRGRWSAGAHHRTKSSGLLRPSRRVRSAPRTWHRHPRRWG